jgi:DNA (cytosine-5)-methyltransferase 1
MHSEPGLAARNLHLVEKMLESNYGSPDHSNKHDPLEELVFILLSQRTKATSFSDTFDRLKNGIGSWEKLVDIDVHTVERLIRSGGMANVKASRLKQIATKLRTDFGRVTLDRLNRWSNERVLEYLVSLPGVGEKTAYCVMMYSLNRNVFPADSNIIRTAHRLGLTRYSPRQHKKAQAELAEVIPPSLAYSLHVNMIDHGRKICKKKPKCGSCDIRNFCAFYRSRRSHNRSARYSFVDLFCGAGGLSSGFRNRGFGLVFAIDNFLPAVETFRLNHPEIPEERILLRDIRSLKESELKRLCGGKKIDVVVGGPPCQGFSLAGARIRSSVNGMRFKDDERNKMYREFIRIVRTLRPSIFVMENVLGLGSAKDGHYRRAILRSFERGKTKYAVRELRLDASDYGVPQRRMRLWFIGAKSGRGGKKASSRVLDVVEEELKRQRVREKNTFAGAMKGLPRVGPGEGTEVTTLRKPVPRTDNAWIFNHVAREHNPRDIELFKLLKPGETGYDAVHKYGRKDLMPFRTDIFPDKYRKLLRNEPAPTIVAHLEKDAHMFIHPDSPRGLTVRESARLQTFPDSYLFAGPFAKQFRQVGNAVPPLLAKKGALAVKKGLGEMSNLR